jgi:hypothetical protein
MCEGVGDGMTTTDDQKNKTQETQLVAAAKSIESPSSPIANEFKSPLGNVPWTLEQFFKGKIDLDKELVMRFPNMPLMSTINFRNLGTNLQRGVATLATSDASATLVVDANGQSKVVQFSFTYGSMLTLRFKMDSLSEMDRARWLDLMRRKQNGLTFMWGQSRWEKDYVICVSRKYYTSLLAFSNKEFESAVRMTPDVTKQLIDWLEGFWKPAEPPANEPPPPQLLSW